MRHVLSASGTHPVNRLSESSSRSRLDRLPSSGGISPLRSLPPQAKLFEVGKVAQLGRDRPAQLVAVGVGVGVEAGVGVGMGVVVSAGVGVEVGVGVGVSVGAGVGVGVGDAVGVGVGVGAGTGVAVGVGVGAAQAPIRTMPSSAASPCLGDKGRNNSAAREATLPSAFRERVAPVAELRAAGGNCGHLGCGLAVSELEPRLLITSEEPLERVMAVPRLLRPDLSGAHSVVRVQ